MTAPTVGTERRTLHLLADALVDAGCTPRRRGDHIDARCPAHDDRTPSLSVDWRDGAIYVCCQTGCTTEDVMTALGLPMRDLYDTPREGRDDTRAPRPRRQRAPRQTKPAAPACLGTYREHAYAEVTRYPYTDADGTLVGYRIRKACRRGGCDAKSFGWRRLDTAGSEQPGRPDPLPLYRLPDVLVAIAEGRPVYVTEGEKDADAVTAAGGVACTMGAADNGRGSTFKAHHREALAGATEVIVPADRDKPGRTSARYIAGQLLDAGVPIVRIVEAAEGKDVADHLAAGHTLDQLRELHPDTANPEGVAERVDGEGMTDQTPEGLGARDDGDAMTERQDADPSRTIDLTDHEDQEISVSVGADPLPVPGSPGWTYYPGVGVWKGKARVLRWCPTVSRHLITRGSRGDVQSRRVTIEVGDQAVTVPTADVADGAVWVDRFPAAAGVATRDVRDVLRNIVDDQAARLPRTTATPEWAGGRLILPPADVLPRGYGITAGTPADFRAIVQRAAEVPKLALVEGLAVGGLYVLPLDMQSLVLHLPGRGRQGKTTAARLAASIFGRPSEVMLPWNTTENGLAAWLRGVAVLTGFRDELGAAGFRPDRLSSTVFRVTQGAERDVSGRTGEHRESRGSWHGALISTGNEAITSQIANEGIAARVVELSAPLTPSAAYAEDLDALIRRGYGHGLAALVDAGPDPETLAEWLPAIEDAVGVPGGGVERTLGKSLALGVAGARVLGDLFDVGDLEPAALVAAREALVELAAALAERGANPGDRLLRAIESAMASEPASFPTRHYYEQAIAEVDGYRLTRETYGWDLSGDDLPGDVAIITGQLRGIAEAEGIADTTVALKELARRNPPALLRQDDGKNLARRIRVGTKTPRAYVFAGIEYDSTDPCSD
ncbi:MAG: DUF927 domain-containing protein, partial [Gallionellaceae bacterium]|nr:DUF927 domain-containing protein [Gallionellaceae bacterium]